MHAQPRWRLLGRFDERDVALQQVVDERADLDALGLGALGEVLAHVGVQIHRELQGGVVAVELAALGAGEIILILHGGHRVSSPSYWRRSWGVASRAEMIRISASLTEISTKVCTTSSKRC